MAAPKSIRLNVGLICVETVLVLTFPFSPAVFFALAFLSFPQYLCPQITLGRSDIERNWVAQEVTIGRELFFSIFATSSLDTAGTSASERIAFPVSGDVSFCSQPRIVFFCFFKIFLIFAVDSNGATGS